MNDILFGIYFAYGLYVAGKMLAERFSMEDFKEHDAALLGAMLLMLSLVCAMIWPAILGAKAALGESDE